MMSQSSPSNDDLKAQAAAQEHNRTGMDRRLLKKPVEQEHRGADRRANKPGLFGLLSDMLRLK
jgi:hypothetical protein